MISDVLNAKRGFDRQVRSAWHLLIPCHSRDPNGHGYNVDGGLSPKDYSEDLAYSIAEEHQIPAAALPCIVFRAGRDAPYFLKLGGKERGEVMQILREIGDLANECHINGPKDADQYRSHVNRAVVNHLRGRRLLSAAVSVLPLLGAVIGTAVDIRDLVR